MHLTAYFSFRKSVLPLPDEALFTQAKMKKSLKRAFKTNLSTAADEEEEEEDNVDEDYFLHEKKKASESVIADETSKAPRTPRSRKSSLSVVGWFRSNQSLFRRLRETVWQHRFILSRQVWWLLRCGCGKTRNTARPSRRGEVTAKRRL